MLDATRSVPLSSTPDEREAFIRLMDEEYLRCSDSAEVDAREEGYRAYQAGLMADDNPYNNNDEWDLHLAWQEGWGNAAWDD